MTLFLKQNTCIVVFYLINSITTFAIPLKKNMVQSKFSLEFNSKNNTPNGKHARAIKHHKNILKEKTEIEINKNTVIITE